MLTSSKNQAIYSGILRLHQIWFNRFHLLFFSENVSFLLSSWCKKKDFYLTFFCILHSVAKKWRLKANNKAITTWHTWLLIHAAQNTLTDRRWLKDGYQINFLQFIFSVSIEKFCCWSCFAFEVSWRTEKRSPLKVSFYFLL